VGGLKYIICSLDGVAYSNLRFEALNVFRFVAAIIIILFHLNFPRDIVYKNINFHIPTILFAGPCMVTFFFVLSGFVMTIAYYNQSNDLLLSRNYWLNRVSRIYPVYILALLLTIIVLGVNHVDPALIFNLVLLQAWFPHYIYALNGPGWALSVEAFFYVSFPLALFYLRKKDHYPYHLILIALSFWVLTQTVLTALLNSSLYGGVYSDLHEYIYHSPLPHLSSFLLGIAGGYLIIKRQNLLRLPEYISFGLFFSVIIIGSYMIGNWNQQIIGVHIPANASFFGPLFLLFILSTAMINNTYLGRILSNRLFLILGASSYALYILQYPIHELLYKSIFPISGISEGRNMCIFLVIEIILSIITFYIIERPVKRGIEGLIASLR